MAKAAKSTKPSIKAKKNGATGSLKSTDALSAVQLMEDLEAQFQQLQKKIGKARRGFLSSLQQDVDQARNKVQKIQTRLTGARIKSARAAVDLRKNATGPTRTRLKKARAAHLSLNSSLQEARETLVAAQSRLHTASSFDRKLAARAKVLQKFESDWEKKTRMEATARAKRAKKAAAKRKLTARKRARKSPAAAKSTRKITSKGTR